MPASTMATWRWSIAQSICRTRQYARILEGWVEELELDSTEYGTHDALNQGDAELSANEESARCAATSGSSKLESTMRYLRHRGE
jgi:hypothetical protein